VAGLSNTIPPDNVASGDTGHIAAHNNMSDLFTNAVTRYNILNTAWSGGADPTGAADSTAAINAALAAAPAGTVVTGPAGTYKTTAPIVVPNFVGFQLRPMRAMGIPIGNYGIGGLALNGGILKPSSSFSGAAVVSMIGSASQGGGQDIRGVTIDGTSLPAGSVHGIYGHGGIGGVTLRDNLVYHVTGNGLHCDSDGTSQPDFWHVMACKFSGSGGKGVSISGLADTWFTDCEATGNTGDGWNITNGNNCRYTACKGEGSTAGFGWNLTGASGYTGFIEFSNCTSELNSSGGWQLTGTGTGTYYLNFCHAKETPAWTYTGTNNVRSPAAYVTSTSAPTLS